MEKVNNKARQRTLKNREIQKPLGINGWPSKAATREMQTVHINEMAMKYIIITPDNIFRLKSKSYVLWTVLRQSSNKWLIDSITNYLVYKKYKKKLVEIRLCCCHNSINDSKITGYRTALVCMAGFEECFHQLDGLGKTSRYLHIIITQSWAACQLSTVREIYKRGH